MPQRTSHRANERLRSVVAHLPPGPFTVQEFLNYATGLNAIDETRDVGACLARLVQEGLIWRIGPNIALWVVSDAAEPEYDGDALRWLQQHAAEFDIELGEFWDAAQRLDDRGVVDSSSELAKRIVGRLKVGEPYERALPIATDEILDEDRPNPAPRVGVRMG